MNTTEIIVREVQGDSGFQVRQLFAERIREPRKSPHRHSDRQVLPFYKRSADMSRVGVALSNFGYNTRDKIRQAKEQIASAEKAVDAIEKSI